MAGEVLCPHCEYVHDPARPCGYWRYEDEDED